MSPHNGFAPLPLASKLTGPVTPSKVTARTCNGKLCKSGAPCKGLGLCEGVCVCVCAKVALRHRKSPATFDADSVLCSAKFCRRHHSMQCWEKSTLLADTPQARTLYLISQSGRVCSHKVLGTKDCFRGIASPRRQGFINNLLGYFHEMTRTSLHKFYVMMPTFTAPEFLDVCM